MPDAAYGSRVASPQHAGISDLEGRRISIPGDCASPRDPLILENRLFVTRTQGNSLGESRSATRTGPIPPWTVHRQPMIQLPPEPAPEFQRGPKLPPPEDRPELAPFLQQASA
ncbi:MAG: hypothetical protein ACI8X5_003888 [Planctomycetota bacterium]|jgi:hypothetical protein